MEEETRLWRYLALLVLPLPLMHTHSALALVLICLACGVYTLVCRPRTKAVLAPWGWFALVCGVVWLVEMWNTVFAQSLDGQHMLRLHLNWINGQDDGTLKDNYFWFYIKNIGLVYLLLILAFFHAKPKQRWLYGGGLAILVLAEFVVFQPNNYDNNKLLYIWHLLGFSPVGGQPADGLVQQSSCYPLAGAGAVPLLLYRHVWQCADCWTRSVKRLLAVERRRHCHGGLY